MLLVCYEIGTNLFVAILLLIIFLGLSLILYISCKKCIECEKINQEYWNRELMYLKSNVLNFDGEYKVEIKERENDNNYIISIKKSIKEKNNG